MYQKLNWKDGVRNPAHTYNVTNNPDGTVTLMQAGEVVQAGTPVNSTNMNRFEDFNSDIDLANKLLLFGLRFLKGGGDASSEEVQQLSDRVDNIFDALMTGRIRTTLVDNDGAALCDRGQLLVSTQNLLYS